MTTSPKPGLKLSFRSKLENWEEGMDYCAISVPASITKKLGTKSAVMVMAQVNGSDPFKVSLFPVGGGQHFIRVRAKVRKQANLKEGDSVTVKCTVLDRAEITIPKDVSKAFAAAGVTAQFKALSPGKKKLYSPTH